MEVLIESVDHEARGIARSDNKVIFVQDALPRETVEIAIKRRKPSFDTAVSTAVKNPSSARVIPRCPSFGICGGCSFQHIDMRTQLAIKQRVLEDAFARLGKVSPERILSPISGPSLGYRTRARLSSRFVIKKDKSLVGFREKGKGYVVDMISCDILPPRISRLLPELRVLIGSLTIKKNVPQIEVACSETSDILAFRILEDLTQLDAKCLFEFGRKQGVCIYTQRGGPQTLKQIYPDVESRLTYQIPDFNLEFEFGLSEFTQVNTEVNGVLVRRAMSLLQPKTGERIADLFCGLGNFSLAIAKHGSVVIGVEGSQDLTRRAYQNAKSNDLLQSCEFRVGDLFEESCPSYERLGPLDKLLIDPPRDGAFELVKTIPGDGGPKSIVYVSCNPATLARDAGILVREKGYRLTSASIVNMFPHTSHVESIASFEK
jgi:23S rRNA (uracil1939-C5)-methyltransferase